MKLHRILFNILLVILPIQTRILFHAEKGYISWYFNYHLAIFLYLTDIVIISCFTAWLLFDPPKMSILKNSRLIWWFTGFLIIGSLSLFHVKQVGLGLYELAKWIELFLILLYIYSNYNNKQVFHTSAILLFLSGVLQAGLAWFQFHVQHGLNMRWLGEYIAPLGTPGLATLDTVNGKLIRGYGTMPHPNVLGAFLIVALICGLYIVSRATLKSRIPVALGLFIIMVGIFVSFSRAAWFAAGITIFSFILFSWLRKQWMTLIIIFAISIVSCATIMTLYSSSLHTRIKNSDDRSVSDRKFFNQIGIDLIKHSPVLGTGVGNYIPAMMDVRQLQPWQYQPAHNIFIFIGAELGLLGLGLFILLLYEIFSQLKYISWDYLSVSVTLAAILILIMGQLDHYSVTIQQGRLLFAVVLGLVAALPKINNQNT